MKFTNLQNALAVTQKSTVTTLDLSNQQLQSLPEKIGEFTNLRVLYLQDNQLKNLPASLGRLKNLSTLYLSKNQLENLPDSIGLLQKLIHLEVDHNVLNDVPKTLADLAQLKRLNIAHNRLKELPSQIGSLKSLQEFYCQSNSIKSLPASFFQLEQLQKFNAISCGEDENIPVALFDLFKRKHYLLFEKKEDAYYAEAIFKNNGDIIAQMSVEKLLYFLQHFYGKNPYRNRQQLTEEFLIFAYHIENRLKELYLKNPLTTDSTISLLGTTGFSKSEILEKLSDRNISVFDKIMGATTHLVMGKMLDFEIPNQLSDFTIVPESSFLDFLFSIDCPFLLEEETDAGDFHQNIDNLVFSADENNMELALELLKAGGVPPELFTAVFWIAKTSENSEVRDEARKLLQIYAPAGINKTVDLPVPFRFGPHRYHLTGLIKTLKRYMALTSELDWERIVEYLEMKYNTNLKKRLNLATRIKKLDNLQLALAPSNIRRVQSLDLTGQKLEELPEAIGMMEKLRFLKLTGNSLSSLPESIGKLKNLTRLTVDNNRLKSLPASIGQLKKLKFLDVHKNDISALPKSIGGLTALQTLDMRKNHITELPTGFEKLENLERWVFGGNPLTVVPHYVFDMPKLVTFRSTNYRHYGRNNKHELFEPFEKAFIASGLLSDKKETCKAIFVGKPEIVRQYELSELFLALKVKNNQIKTNALKFIFKHSNQIPLDEKSHVVVLGKINISRNLLRSKLKEIGVKYQTKINAKTTHIVVGENPEWSPMTNNQAYTFLKEKDVLAAINEKANPQHSAEDNPAVAFQDNILALLSSSDEKNVTLGLNFLEGDSIPNEILENLLVIYKLTKDKYNRDKAKKLLKIHAPNSYLKAISLRTHLGVKGANKGYRAEKRLAKSLAQYASTSSEINWSRVAWLVYQKCGHGLRYFFDNEPPGSALRQEVLAALIEDGTLDFFKFYATYMPNYSFGYQYSYYKQSSFPEDVCQFTELTRLSFNGCRLGNISPQIKNLKNLTSLTLRGNFIMELPDEIGELQQLTHLDISNNEFYVFPKVIYKLKNLKELNISNNRYESEPSPIKVPDELGEILPNCRVVQ